MGISVFLVWQTELSTNDGTIAFILFWVQLSVNALWSIVFFGIRSTWGGFITIVALWFLILATIVVSLPISIWAGVLLIPYIVWVSIALYLNAGVWLLNRST